jgi:hypothetical protein
MSACAGCGIPWTRTNKSVAHPSFCLTCAGSGERETDAQMQARLKGRCTAAHTAQALADEARARMQKRGGR